MFVEPGVKVYEGMIVGMNSRGDDMVVNPCKAKKVSKYESRRFGRGYQAFTGEDIHA